MRWVGVCDLLSAMHLRAEWTRLSMLNSSHRVPGHIVRSNLQRESMLRCHQKSDHTLASAKPCSVPGQGQCVACSSMQASCLEYVCTLERPPAATL